MTRFGWLFVEDIHDETVSEALKKVAQQVLFLRKHEEELRVASPPPCNDHFTRAYRSGMSLNHFTPPTACLMRTAFTPSVTSSASRRPTSSSPLIRCLQGLHANVVVRSQGRPRREPEDPTGGSLVTDSVLHQLRAHHSLSDLATLVVRHL